MDFNEARVAIGLTTSILKKVKPGEEKRKVLPGKYAAQEGDTDMQVLLKRLAYVEKLLSKEEA
jgi:hypothetical protein